MLAVDEVPRDGAKWAIALWLHGGDMTLSQALILTLSALCVFLAFALAGALRERSALLRRIASTEESVPRVPPWMSGRSVLLVSPDCPACAAALEELRESTTGHHVTVLSTQPLASRSDAVVDALLWHDLHPGYTPALVTVDRQLRIQSVEPVGSRAAMKQRLQLLTAGGE